MPVSQVDNESLLTENTLTTDPSQRRRQHRRGSRRPQGPPGGGSDGPSDSSGGSRDQRSFGRGRSLQRPSGRNSSPRLRLPDKFPFAPIPRSAAGILKWFAEMEQLLNPYWPDIEEGYAWLLLSTNLEHPVEQLADLGSQHRIDAVIATTLLHLIREAMSYHPELNRRLNDRLLDCRKMAMETGRPVILKGRQVLRLMWLNRDNT